NHRSCFPAKRHLQGIEDQLGWRFDQVKSAESMSRPSTGSLIRSAVRCPARSRKSSGSASRVKRSKAADASTAFGVDTQASTMAAGCHAGRFHLALGGPE